MRFLATAGLHSLATAYPLNAEEIGIGPRRLERRFGSLASCAGGAIVALLLRAGQRRTRAASLRSPLMPRSGDTG